MRRRAFLASVAIALAGCSSSAEEPRESAPDTTRSVGGATVEVSDWVDDTASYGGAYSAVYVEASGEPPAAAEFTAAFDDGTEAYGGVPHDSESYGEHGEDRYHSPGAPSPGEEREELSGYVFFHPDSDDVRIESVSLRSSTWERE